LSDLLSIDVLVLVAVEVNLDRDSRREIELAVEGAGAVAGFHGGRGAELVDPGSAGGGAVKAGLDAVALVSDMREGEIDFGDDAGDVEASDIWVGVLEWRCRELGMRKGVLTANAALVSDLEVGADTGLGITLADCQRPGCDADGEDWSSDNEGWWEMHFDDDENVNRWKIVDMKGFVEWLYDLRKYKKMLLNN
jgi:hypothetical protein